jgi:hypothetical protein
MDSPPHIAAHKHSSRHRTEVLASERCGCFYCLAIFDPSDIPDWVDESHHKDGGGKPVRANGALSSLWDSFSDRVSVGVPNHT